ncbi:glycosyltransferase [Humibacter antri]
MATYNGERYVTAQLNSILAELNEHDEVIVIDDASTDGTVRTVEAIADARVKLIARQENRGYVATFQEAISSSRGEYVLLADQDDVWVPGRVDAMLTGLGTHAVVASNMTILGSGERPRWWMSAATARQWRRNVLRIVAGVSGYYGCGMGLRREFVRVILPFPHFLVESHDLWVALAGNIAHSISILEQPTLQRRLHGDNATPLRPRSLPRVLAARIMLLRSILVLSRRVRRSAAAIR